MARQLRGNRIPTGNMKRAAWWYYYMGGGSGGGGAVPESVPFAVSSQYRLVTGRQTIGGINTGNNAQQFYSPKCLWRAGKTYLVYNGLWQYPPFGQANLIVYDEKYGFDKPMPLGIVPTTTDTHYVPIVGVTEDNVYAFHESAHNAPIRIYKSLGDDYLNWSLLAEQIGTVGGTNQLAYCQMFLDANGNAVNWIRGVTNGWHGYYLRASDGYEGWGASERITTSPNGATFSHYPAGLFGGRNRVGSTYYLVFSARNDNAAEHYAFYLILTDDFVTFRNIENTWSKSIAGGNYLDGFVDEELDDNARYEFTGNTTTNGLFPYPCIGENGEFYSVQRGDGVNYSLVRYIPGDGWDTVAVPGAPTAIFKHTDYLEYFSGVTRYTSVDDGDNWTNQGSVCPEIRTGAAGLILPNNYLDIPDNRNFGMFILGSSREQDSLTHSYYLKVASKNGYIKNEVAWSPAAGSLSDAYNLFRYRATNADIVRSGNDVSQLTDIYGLRNATGVNNPQWNGSDEITLNGIDSYFTIPTTGLTAITEFTLFAVVRGPVDQKTIILSVSDKDAATHYLEFDLAGSLSGYKPSVSLTKGTTTKVPTDYGQQRADDEELHLLAFVLDGRTRCDIYVDGIKQDYETNRGVLSEYQERGQSFANLANIDTIRIGSLDTSGTDQFSELGFKELIGKSKSYDRDTLGGIMKAIANDHGITLGNYFDPKTRTAPAKLTYKMESISNKFVDLYFDKLVYGAAAGPVEASDFAISNFVAGGASNISISSVKRITSAIESDATAISEGENGVRIFFSITGTPDGTETFDLSCVGVFDANANEITDSLSIKLNIHPHTLWEAANTTEITTTGSGISLLDDVMGTLNLTQDTDGNRPVLFQNAIQHDGTNKYFDGVNYPSFDFQSASDYAIVIKDLRVNVTTGQLIGTYAAPATNAGWRVYGTSTSLVFQMTDGSGFRTATAPMAGLGEKATVICAQISGVAYIFNSEGEILASSASAVGAINYASHLFFVGTRVNNNTYLQGEWGKLSVIIGTMTTQKIKDICEKIKGIRKV